MAGVKGQWRPAAKTMMDQTVRIVCWTGHTPTSERMAAEVTRSVCTWLDTIVTKGLTCPDAEEIHRTELAAKLAVA
jgi:hypothetical protein